MSGLSRAKLWLLIVAIGHVGADVMIFSTLDKTRVEESYRDLPARFGGFLPMEGIYGLVVYASPPTACQDIVGPPDLKNYTGNWIVLIARMNCSFEVKIRSAERAGYDLAIVHNVGSDELEPMSAKNSIGILIPAVFVSEYTGLAIRDNYTWDKKYLALVNDVPLNINTHLLLPFAIVVGICFLVMLIFMIVRCIQDRRRQRRHRLPNSSLKKIPTHKYTKGDPYETCAICLEDYAEGDKLRVLPCAHAYHSKCIDPWLTKNRRVCPVCKRKVFAADERIESDTDSDSDVDDSTPLIRNSTSGTQGGTFTSQTENSFLRVQRTRRQRRDSNNSGSSLDSNRPIVQLSDDGVSMTPSEEVNIVNIIDEVRKMSRTYQLITGSAVLPTEDNAAAEVHIVTTSGVETGAATTSSSTNSGEHIDVEIV